MKIEKTCEKKCEVYSRVCGYFRPVSNWNHGKREEFKDRRTFAVASKAGAVLLAALLLTGCASQTIAQGLVTKNVSGNGTFIDTHLGLNTDTKIPEIRTLFVSGDLATNKAGTNQISYREESSASVWNSSSVTRKRFLSITLTDSADVPAVIRAVSEVFRAAEAEAIIQK